MRISYTDSFMPLIRIVIQRERGYLQTKGFRDEIVNIVRRLLLVLVVFLSNVLFVSFSTN